MFHLHFHFTAIRHVLVICKYRLRTFVTTRGRISRISGRQWNIVFLLIFSAEGHVPHFRGCNERHSYRRNQRLIRTLRTVLIWHLQIYSYSQSWRRYSEINIFLDPEVQTVNLINSKQESCFLDEMKKWIKCFEKNVEKIIIFIVSTINVLHFQTGFNILPLLILMLHSWRPYNSTRTFTKFLSISFLVE